ncbi:MAG: n-acetylglutamate synthase [Saprospiraceae bacterium]
MVINYHGRKFTGVSNSASGQVSGETVFEYFQHENLITGLYSGGSILSGQIIGLVYDDNSLHFVYHHIDVHGQLRNGYCHSKPEILEEGRIRLYETWEWTYGGEGKGESVIEEIPA